MKKTKKLMAVVIAILLVVVSVVPAFAAGDYTITINNSSSNVSMNGITYNAYRVFDVTLSGYDQNGENPTNYAYEVNADFADFSYNGYSDDDFVAYVATLSDQSDELNAFAEAVKNYITDNSISATGSVTATADDEAVINVTELGYYLVMETATSVDGSNTLTAFCALNTTNNNAEVNLKVDAPTIAKQVKENGETAYGAWTDAEIGETVNFLLTVTVPTYANYYDTYTYIVHDTMDSGLTMTDGTLKVYSDSALTTEVTATNYTVTTDDDCTFDLQLNSDFVQANTGKTFYIAYDATVNSTAKIYTNSNDNSANIEYSNDAYDESSTTTTTDKTVKVYSYSFDLLKYYMNNSTETPLKDAKFKLYSDAACENEIALVKVDDTTYRVALDGETVADYIVSVEEKITINGLDDAVYYLKEMVAPDGYNLIETAITVTVDATAKADNSDVESVSIYQDDNADAVEYIGVENKSGSLLPFTGGIGSMIFYVVGGALVIGACILLITHLRVSGKKEEK